MPIQTQRQGQDHQDCAPDQRAAHPAARGRESRHVSQHFLRPRLCAAGTAAVASYIFVNSFFIVAHTRNCCGPLPWRSRKRDQLHRVRGSAVEAGEDAGRRPRNVTRTKGRPVSAKRASQRDAKAGLYAHLEFLPIMASLRDAASIRRKRSKADIRYAIARSRPQAGLGAVGSHAVEGDLLAIRPRPGDGAPAVAVRDQRDRVAAQWSTGTGEAVEAVYDFDGTRGFTG